MWKRHIPPQHIKSLLFSTPIHLGKTHIMINMHTGCINWTRFVMCRFRNLCFIHGWSRYMNIKDSKYLSSKYLTCNWAEFFAVMYICEDLPMKCLSITLNCWVSLWIAEYHFELPGKILAMQKKIEPTMCHCHMVDCDNSAWLHEASE